MTYEDLRFGIVVILALIGLKSLIFGQYWPWQYHGQCPYCKRRYDA